MKIAIFAFFLSTIAFGTAVPLPPNIASEYQELCQSRNPNVIAKYELKEPPGYFIKPIINNGGLKFSMATNGGDVIFDPELNKAIHISGDLDPVHQAMESFLQL